MTRARRPQGTGSLVEMRPGVWRARITIGRDPVKKAPIQMQRIVRVKGKREAEAILRDLIKEVQGGAHGGQNSTVGYVLDEWVKQMPATRSPKTVHEARRTVNGVLAPLRPVRLRELSPRHLDLLYRRLEAEGHKPASIRRYHACLSAALKMAERWGWLVRSPADRALLPESRPTKMRVPTQPERLALVQEADTVNPAFGALLRLALFTGARRGELCALRWTDVEEVEVDGETFVVLQFRRSLYRAGKQRGVKGTKTDRQRTVRLAPEVADWLGHWRAHCIEVARGTLAPDAFVAAASPDGQRPVNPDSLSSFVYRTCKALGIEGVHLHSMRHVAGTEMIGEGVDPRTAADVLGHAQPSVTLGIYAKSDLERQRKSAAVLGRVLTPALPSSREEQP